MRGDKTEMTVEKISNLELSEHAPLRVCKAGNVIEVKYLQHVNTRATVRKLSADFFQPSATIIVDSENSNHTPLNYSIIDYPNKDGVWLIKKLMTSPY